MKLFLLSMLSIFFGMSLVSWVLLSCVPTLEIKIPIILTLILLFFVLLTFLSRKYEN